MDNINNLLSDNQRFYLSKKNFNPILCENIYGWNKYGLEAARNMDYHGTVNKVTNELGFKSFEKQYILEEFKANGILGQIVLIREYLYNDKSIGEVVWRQDDPVYINWNKLGSKNGFLTAYFDSDSLNNLIDSYEDTDFEVERLEDVNNKTIPELEEDFIELKGRSTSGDGESNAVGVTEKIGRDIWDNRWGKIYTPVSRIISRGPNRHSSVDDRQCSNYSGFSCDASNLFYVNEVGPGPDVLLNFTIDYDYRLYSYYNNQNKLRLYKVKYIDGTGDYQIVSFEDIQVNPRGWVNRVGSITRTMTLKWDEGLLFGMYIHRQSFNLKLNYNIKIYEQTIVEATQGVRFAFYHDILEKLMEIISGEKSTFKSSVLGRVEKGYSQDGKLGLIGFISGLWARSFVKGSEKYKSPKISLKNAVKSISNVFALGSGIEKVNGLERLVVEELEHFYRPETIGRFPLTITNPKRVVDEKSYYSTMEFGYDRSNTDRNEMGLDEPNVKSSFITPVANSRNKFIKTSKVRADEYPLEDLRNKKQENYPNDSFSGDEDNWFLDLKRSNTVGVNFEQVHWSDRLSQEPTGIHSPETFRSMLFTPMQILKRHASNFKSGIYLYKDKFLNFTSNSSNRTLSTKFIGETIEYKESDNVRIGNLKQPIFKNEKVTFNHPYTQELYDLIFGYTLVNVNGEERQIPNIYFKFEWINEDDQIERGYFLKYKNDDTPVFEFQIANEEII